jgi:hypothetical protein
VRTRANGQPLTAQGIIEDALALESDPNRGRRSTRIHELDRDLRELLTQEYKTGFDAGFQLAAQVEQRVAREALARYALEVLGKDRADGEVDLGALGKHYAA